MNPQEIIDKLDNALAEYGEDVILRRNVGTGQKIINADVICRASVQPYRLRSEEIVGALTQNMLLVTISPTQIKKAQWPGGTPPGQKPDPSLPRKTDQLTIQGAPRAPQTVGLRYVQNVLVRIEFMVLG